MEELSNENVKITAATLACVHGSRLFNKHQHRLSISKIKEYCTLWIRQLGGIFITQLDISLQHSDHELKFLFLLFFWVSFLFVQSSSE